MNFDKFRSNVITRTHCERVFDKYLPYNRLSKASLDKIWAVYSDGNNLN